MRDLVSNHSTVSYNAENRWTAERSRLAGEAAADPTVTSIVLVHGIRPMCDGQKVGYGQGMSGTSFYTSLMKTTYAFGVHVECLPDHDQACRWVALLCKNLRDNKLDVEGAVKNVDAAPPSLVRKTARDGEPIELLVGVLSALPGVSKVKAAHVALHVNSLRGLCDISVADLAKVDVGGKRLGPAASKRLKSIC